MQRMSICISTKNNEFTSETDLKGEIFTDFSYARHLVWKQNIRLRQVHNFEQYFLPQSSYEHNKDEALNAMGGYQVVRVSRDKTK